jgi:hypothetical protein
MAMAATAKASASLMVWSSGSHNIAYFLDKIGDTTTLHRAKPANTATCVFQ